MQRIMVTGANGFIGSEFVKIYDKKYNIKKVSLSSKEDLNFENIDIIVHLSALVHQMGGATKEEYEKINVEQTLKLATNAKNNNVKHFIFMSTIKVYGEETNIPYNEDSGCIPQDDYGISKLQAEEKLKQLESDKFKI
jgi:UDP-glucose 4-epimerase